MMSLALAAKVFASFFCGVAWSPTAASSLSHKDIWPEALISSATKSENDLL
jgi:hypothetical protein